MNKTEKKIEGYRKEMDKVIEEHDFDMSNKEVVKRSLEIEKEMFDIAKKAEKKKE